MGQRTAILVKKTKKDGTAIINLIHHQWGIGKTLPAIFMQEKLDEIYPKDRTWGTPIIEKSWNFEPLSNEKSNYVYNEKVLSSEVDVWNKDTYVKYFNETDNNNGGMIVEVIEGERDYSIDEPVKVGFVLGSEEISDRVSKDEWVEREKEFERLVTSEEFMLRTGFDFVTKTFLTCWNNFKKTFDVVEMAEPMTKEELKKLKAQLKREHRRNWVD